MTVAGEGWAAAVADEVGVQRVVLTCEGEDTGAVDFHSISLPCAYDSFFSCLSCHWAARLERLDGKPIRGRHRQWGGGTLGLDVALRGKVIEMSGRVVS